MKRKEYTPDWKKKRYTIFFFTIALFLVVGVCYLMNYIDKISG